MNFNYKFSFSFGLKVNATPAQSPDRLRQRGSLYENLVIAPKPKNCMRKTAMILLLIAGLFCKAEAQKGEKSIAAGILVAFPENKNIIYMDNRSWEFGVGLEGIGQYNFTEKSAALLQLQLTRFTGHTYYPNIYVPASFISVSLKGGYRYQFTASGFYANVLAGVESGTDGLHVPAALGIGKRFTMKDVYFLDAGIDYTGGFISRFNIKAVFSFLRRPTAN